MPKGEIIGLFVVCGVGIYCASCASLVFLFLHPKIVEDNSDLRNGGQASFYWRKSCLLAYRRTASISISSGSQFEPGYLVQTRARQRNLANLTTLQSTRASFVVCKEGHTMKYLALLERRFGTPKSKFRNDIKSFIDVICSPNSAHKILSSSDQWKIFSSLQRVRPSAEKNRGAFPTNDKTVSRTMAGNLQYEGLT